MSAVAFLLLAFVIAAVGSAVLYLRHRTPRSVESGIDSFRREMAALASTTDEPAGGRPPLPGPPVQVQPVDPRQPVASEPVTSSPAVSPPAASSPVPADRVR
jgi:hypothetical protein